MERVLLDGRLERDYSRVLSLSTSLGEGRVDTVDGETRYSNEVSNEQLNIAPQNET